jgi:hypothetical protein
MWTFLSSPVWARLEMERVGHNLTSVMMNPRDGGVSELEVSQSVSQSRQ